MTKISFNQPSEGFVNDIAPGLQVMNNSGVGILAFQLSFKPPTFPLGYAPPLLALSEKQTGISSVSIFGPAIAGISGTAGAVNGLTHGDNIAALNGVNLAPPPTPPPPSTPSSPGPATHGPSAPPAPPPPSPGYGVFGYTDRPSGAGVLGIAPNKGNGVVGVSLAGPGVLGSSDAGPGVEATSTQAEGLKATAFAANASAVSARSDNGFGVSAFSQNGTAIDAGTTTGIGLKILTAKGASLYPFDPAPAGAAIVANTYDGTGLKIETISGASIEVEAVLSAKTCISAHSRGTAINVVSSTAGGVEASGKTGVAGASMFAPIDSDRAVGCGVIGSAALGVGVYGLSLQGNGVVGETPNPLAFAGLFKGSVFVQGALYKSASMFSIEHPLSPRRRLNHAAIEAPEYKTFYDGVATLNARGEARVRMAKWFDALNSNIRYQLTPIGSPMPELHIASEMRKGVFVIAGGRARGKVSWQVTGVRRDKWARANPLKVEQPQSDFAAIPPDTDMRPMIARLKQQENRARELASRKAVAKPAQEKKGKAKTVKPPSRRERDAYLAVAEKTVKDLSGMTATLKRLRKKRR